MILSLLGVLINISEVPLIHNFAHGVLLRIYILNLKSAICHNYQILNHLPKIIITHHKVLLGYFFSKLQK